MSKFKPGDRVCRNDNPEEIYTVSDNSALNASKHIWLDGLVDCFNADDFRLAPELDKKQMGLGKGTPEERDADPDEGEPCPQWQCSGRMEIPPVENCSCLIAPPCNACVNNPFQCSECGWSYGDEIILPIDPSVKRDENEGYAKEFEHIMRKREFDKRVKELKKPSRVAETYWDRVAETYWDGEHLANAIEKTVSTAMTPQAMWKL